MVLELLFIFLLLFGIALISYKSAVHEYEILQRDFSEDVQWSELLQENLPIVLRNVPKSWMGGWVAAKHAARPYTIFVRNAENKKFQTTWNTWIQSTDDTILATPPEITLSTTALSESGFSRWFFLPFSTPVPAALHMNTVLKLRETFAEHTLIVATDGSPLTLWLAHEGALANVDIRGKDPWSITSAECPTIGDVKYIEIRLRPGNAISVPKHWFYALKNEDEPPAWYYTTELNTPISRLVSAFQAP